MLKIKNKDGKQVMVLKDDASEPEKTKCSCKECTCIPEEGEQDDGLSELRETTVSGD